MEMKNYRYLSIPLVLFVILISCSGEKKKLFGSGDSSRWTDQDIPLSELDTGNVNTDSVAIADEMRKLFLPGDSLIEGRPVSFYLNRRDVSPVAKNFYLLHFIPAIDNMTASLCDSLLTKNDTTRPFYYFLFLRLNRISGEDLHDLLQNYALEYITRFVDEFYNKLQIPQYKSDYGMWTDYVYLESWKSSYSGKEMADSSEIYQRIVTKHIQNVKHLTPILRSQIEKFANDVASIAHHAP